MSDWQDFDIENKITQILQDIPDTSEEHHLGRPFLTAYQIAIEFSQRFPNEFIQLNNPVGGSGVGQRTSLSQYLAHQLSIRIKSGEITHIEGGFLSNQHLHDISFDTTLGETIHSSLTNTNFTLSMFRIAS